MRFETKFRLLLHKTYFQKGYGELGMIKYPIVGTFLLDYWTGLIVSLMYTVFCYWFGRFFFKYGWIEAEHEVGNRFNRFVKEMRQNYKN